jgi:methylase of polypeptide subunit release factors
MLAESYQRSNLSGQEWNAWKAAHPDTVTGYTDCGHSAYRAGTVLDPFSGSGTTGLAAQRTGRKYVGIDLNREYLDLSLKTRLNQSALDFEEPA